MSSKEQHGNREARKQPALTLKEKREAKKSKKKDKAAVQPFLNTAK
ncbi:MAG TPA: hypothetical protein VFP70_05285 [Burkholderiales bacterium]|nr:hypothetical protein [Burkholderiales bacterium]